MANPDRETDDIPLTVMLSTEKKTRGLVSVFDDVAAIKAIKVSRARLSSIPDEWKTGCGFYILVSDIVGDNFHAYVGKATQNNFYARLSAHRREKENWSYAFLFQRDTSNGLNSTQASYAEGVIHKILNDCSWISVINNQTAGDKTLADHEVFYMNQVVKSAMRILNIFGYVVDEEVDTEKKKEDTGKTYYGVSIANLIKAGIIHEGEQVMSVMDKYPAEAIVGAKGIIFNGIELAPSSSALEARKVIDPSFPGTVNGWTFWGLFRNQTWMPISEFREHYLLQKKLYENSMLTEKDINFEEAIRANEISRTESVEASTVSDSVAPSTMAEESMVSEEENNLDSDRHKDSKVKVYQLVDAGYLEEEMPLVVVDSQYVLEEEVIIHGSGIAFNGNIYPSPTIAAKYAKRMFEPDCEVPNGWEFWGVQKYDGSVATFSEILDDFLENQ
jgi:hypothetical protein